MYPLSHGRVRGVRGASEYLGGRWNYNLAPQLGQKFGSFRYKFYTKCENCTVFLFKPSLRAAVGIFLRGPPPPPAAHGEGYGCGALPVEAVGAASSPGRPALTTLRGGRIRLCRRPRRSPGTASPPCCPWRRLSMRRQGRMPQRFPPRSPRD